MGKTAEFGAVILSGLVGAGAATAAPLVNTYSIVARDPATGEVGVTVQSRWFSVSSIVSWAEAGVGAISAQFLVGLGYGPRGLAMLREGRAAPDVLELPFWQAVTLASIGREDEAMPIFARVFAAEPQWAALLPRLPASKLLPDDPALIERILAEAPSRQ